MERNERSSEGLASVELEQEVIGAILLNNAILDRVGALDVDHFFEPVHGHIFGLIRDRHAKGEPSSPITLKAHVETLPGLKALGGTQYLARLSAATLSPSAAGEAAASIIELYARRAVVHSAEDAASLARNEGADEALTRLEADTDAIRLSTRRRAPSVTLSAALTRAMHQTIEARDGGAHTPTGLADLDHVIGGLYPGDLLLLGGRPSMGKTTIAQAIGHRISKRGRAVIFGSLEMQPEDVSIRMISEHLRQRNIPIEYQRIRAGALSDDEHKAVLEAAAELEKLPIDVIEPHLRRLPQLVAEIGRMVRRWRGRGVEVGAVIIDYIGLIQPADQRMISDNQRIASISAGLKGAAQELKVPILALSQLSRATEHREEKRPQLSDLRDSGSLEQDADVVIFCYREEYYLRRGKSSEMTADQEAEYHRRLMECAGKLELIVQKQRMGETGIATLNCELAYNAIFDLPLSERASRFHR